MSTERPLTFIVRLFRGRVPRRGRAGEDGAKGEAAEDVVGSSRRSSKRRQPCH
jgi:hypothetical protein